jgi:hypothetical protein
MEMGVGIERGRLALALSSSAGGTTHRLGPATVLVGRLAIWDACLGSSDAEARKVDFIE